MKWMFIGAVLLTTAFGCIEQTGTPPSAVQTKPVEPPALPHPSAETPEPAAVEVAYQVVDKAGYDKVIADHRGKIVVVDLWGTWCESCMANFHHTVAMVGKYQGQPVQVMSLAIDAPGFEETNDEGVRGRIHDFLNQKNAAMVNLVSQEGLTQGLAAGGEIYGFSELPMFKIYDQTGALAATFPRPGFEDFTHQDVEAAVDALLKKSRGTE